MKILAPFEKYFWHSNIRSPRDPTKKSTAGSQAARASSTDSNPYVAARVMKLEELAQKGESVSNADLDQKLAWSGEQKALSVPRRASRSLSPAGSPQE